MSIQNMKRSETTEQIALFNWAKRTESINLSCGQTGNKKIESMEDTLEIINATLGGMVKGNELTVEQSAAVLTVAMKAYEVGKKARIKA